MVSVTEIEILSNLEVLAEVKLKVKVDQGWGLSVVSSCTEDQNKPQRHEIHLTTPLDMLSLTESWSASSQVQDGSRPQILCAGAHLLLEARPSHSLRDLRFHRHPPLLDNHSLLQGPPAT